MVQAINFAVRDSAGAVVRGSVAGDGGNFVQLGNGEEISLNLSPQSVAGYVQQGDDLVITLIDGREIVLSGFFNEGIQPNLLYLSQNGEVIEVELSPAGDGALYATYGAIDSWDKFSALDDLRFAEGDDLALAGGAVTDEPAGMAGFIPGLVGMGGAGAGLAGLGLIGGLLGGGSNPGHTPPTVNGTGTTSTITSNTADKDIDITGTGHPGDTVTVTVGNQTQTTTITPGGTWSVTFPGTSLPPDGTYTAGVTVTYPGGTPVVLVGPGYVIDVTPPEVEVTDGTKSVNDIENAAEHTDGVTITGEGEPGASVVVTVGSHSQTTTVAPDGTWSVTFTTSQVPAGEYQIPVTIVATDPLGNKTTLNDVLVIDTVPHPIAFNQVTTNNTVNGAEATAGFTITGTSTAGATLTVTLQGVSQQVTVAQDGTWSLTWAAGTLTPGEYDATITATTTDAAGNASSQTHTFRVDTTTSVAFAAVAIEGDNVVNAAEAADGVVLTGTAQAGATVQVAWNGVTLPATVAADGSWTVTFPASAIPVGTLSSTATVTATDAAGNTATATRTIQIDTDPNPIGFDPVTSGNMVNQAENAAGFVITGTTAPGASLTLTIQGQTHTVTAGGDGRWQIGFAAGALAAGEYDVTVTATSTDAAGNPSSGTHTFRVDTTTNVAFAPSAVEVDNVVNAAEAADGVVLTGTTQPGNTVQVAWNGVTLPATVAADGSWTVSFPASAIPAGTYSSTATVTASDAAGNTATATRSIGVDTEANPIGFDPVTSGNLVNKAEADAGFMLTGTSVAGATLTVTLQGLTQQVTAGGDGRWSLAFPAGTLMAGEYDATITATSTDAAGNVNSQTHSFRVDTSTHVAFSSTPVEGNDIVNGTEAADGVVLAGTTQPGNAVQVSWNGLTLTAQVAADGSWTASFPASAIPASATLVSSTATVTATDAAGNSATATKSVQIDTSTRVEINATQATDNIVNASERNTGVTFTGTAEAGSSVAVTFDGVTKTVQADGSGNWSASYGASDLRTGSYTATLSVTATDTAGNTATDTHSISVDTDAPGAPNVTSIFSEVPGGLFGIGTTPSDYDYSFFRVDATGSARTIAAEESYSNFRKETQFEFEAPIPDGSYLVINTEDAAGNESSTLFVVNNTSSATVDLTRQGLTGFDLSAIDLTKAPDARLTITEAQLRDLTGPDNTLVIKGDGNDTVTASGAVDTTESRVIDGQTYSIYTLGTGGTLLIDDDIRTVF